MTFLDLLLSLSTGMLNLVVLIIPYCYIDFFLKRILVLFLLVIISYLCIVIFLFLQVSATFFVTDEKLQSYENSEKVRFCGNSTENTQQRYVNT